MKLLRQGKSWRRNIIRNSWAVFRVGQRGFALSWGGEGTGAGAWPGPGAAGVQTTLIVWQLGIASGRRRSREGKCLGGGGGRAARCQLAGGPAGLVESK